jgi:hypothetical protein
MVFGFQGQLFDSWAEIEWQLYSSVSTRNGHFEVDQERLLKGDELGHPKADRRVCQQPAFRSPSAAFVWTAENAKNQPFLAIDNK